jgi:Ser/Thr protein kinase RdoA (MazF antagonist)
MPPSNPHPFESLTPDFLMTAIEAQGFLCDGRLLALNSYENRVYQVGIEGQAPLIAKFYRPNRWSKQQIQEEHHFCFALAEQELPVVVPLRNQAQQSLFQHHDFQFSLFPRQGGHAPELDNLDNLLIIGRLMGRIHSIGATQPFTERPQLNSQNFGHDCVKLISTQFIPADLKPAYDTLTHDLLQRIDETLQQAEINGVTTIRTHGDCHSGNMLWRDNAPHFVDFDDARMAPAIQDLWMFLSGERPRRTAQINELVEGYNEFYDFNPRELHLVEILRTLRMIHYAAWLASRWQDPAFPKSFPWFNSARYWGEHILELREQLSALDEPALELY